MRHLTLLRHGKAAAIEAPDGDSARPLTNSGRKQVKQAAKAVNKLSVPVDLIVSSPARRAAQTAELLAKRIGYEGRIIWREEIYAASAQGLLAVLAALPEDSQHVILVGHNPRVKELISGLCTGTVDRLNLHLPSAGLAHIQLEIFWWNQIRWGCGQLQLLTQPKYLKKRGQVTP